jgi:hypothetical protein
VTDSSPWQPPVDLGLGSDPSVTPFSPPTPATPAAGEAFPPPGGGFPPPSAQAIGSSSIGAQAGWTPPPKPGLIPLRPLTLGALLGASFQVLRRNPRPIFGFALLISGATFFAALLLVGLVAFAAFSRVASAEGSDFDTVSAGAYALVALAGLIGVVLSLVASAVLQGVVSLEVARGTLGERLRLGGLWRAARGRIGALIGWTLLISSAIVVALLVVVLVITLIAAFGGVAGIVVSVLLGIVAFLGAVAAGFWLFTRLSLVPSALMIERLPLRAAIARSWTLTIGSFWKTLGIQLLVAVIINFVTSVVSTPLQLVVTYGSVLINPNGDQTGTVAAFVVIYILAIVLSVIFGAIGSVIQSATAALIYLDLRMRKEGLDLELQRYVEARQAADTSVPDPYLTRTTATGPVAA